MDVHYGHAFFARKKKNHHEGSSSLKKLQLI